MDNVLLIVVFFLLLIIMFSINYLIRIVGKRGVAKVGFLPYSEDCMSSVSNFLKENEIIKALEFLEKRINTNKEFREWYDSIVVNHSSFNKAEKDYRLTQIISRETYNLETNQIIQHLLNLARVVCSDSNQVTVVHSFPYVEEPIFPYTKRRVFEETILKLFKTIEKIENNNLT